MSWVQSTLGEVADIFSGYAFKSADMNSVGGTPLIKIKNIADSAVSHECDAFLNKDFNLAKFERFHLLRDDFLVAMTGQGSVGRIGKMRDYKPGFYVNQRVAIVRVNPEKANPVFIFYQIATRSNELELFKKANGAGQPNISAKQIGELPVVLPSTEQQQYIADVLSSYDDLIVNNQKQIKLLEEAAQRLYKEWFIDLRFPGYETTPIVDGVPEGWRKGKISDFVPTSSGGTPSRTHSEYYSDGTNLWVKTQELNDGFIFDTEEKITDDAIRNSSAKIIPQGSILMAMYGATIGKIGIAATELTCNQACCVFNLSKIKYATSYLYCWLKDNREFFISQGKGAAQPNLSQAMIKNFDVLIPTADILTTFSQVTDTLLELSAKLHLQNRGLIESRDRLLPKLMSGEIEV